MEGEVDSYETFRVTGQEWEAAIDEIVAKNDIALISQANDEAADPKCVFEDLSSKPSRVLARQSL